eukprot:5754530-Amphidinium_carterae.1
MTPPELRPTSPGPISSWYKPSPKSLPCSTRRSNGSNREETPRKFCKVYYRCSGTPMSEKTYGYTPPPYRGKAGEVCPQEVGWAAS